MQTDGDAHDGTEVPTHAGGARPEFARVALGGWFEVLGLEVIRATPTEVLAEWTVAERHLQPMGLVHGGVYASVVESCCSIGAVLAAPEGKQVVGMENHTSFLRPVRSGRLRARAVALHAGRQAQLWECAITDEADRLVATGRLRALCVDAAAATRPPR